jgi:hypothetical protein
MCADLTVVNVGGCGSESAAHTYLILLYEVPVPYQKKAPEKQSRIIKCGSHKGVYGYCIYTRPAKKSS